MNFKNTEYVRVHNILFHLLEVLEEAQLSMVEKKIRIHGAGVGIRIDWEEARGNFLQQG